MLTKGSLSTIVPWPWATARVAFCGFVRFTKKVSLRGSSMVSSTVGTVMVFVVSDTAKVKVPEVGAKSAPLVAVPEAAAKSTSTGKAGALDRVTVNTASLPSGTAAASVIVIVGSTAVVRVSSQPAATLPLSPVTSSSTYNFQAPFGLAPLWVNSTVP